MDFYTSSNETNRFNQLPHHQQSQNLQQQNMIGGNFNQPSQQQVYANNLSKFFDFHKNQQQQHQQQQFPSQQQFYNDQQLNMSSLMDQSRLMDARRLNPQYLEQQNTPNSKQLNHIPMQCH